MIFINISLKNTLVLITYIVFFSLTRQKKSPVQCTRLEKNRKNDLLLEHAVAEDLLAHRAFVFELRIGQTLNMAIDIAAVLHQVVALHSRQVFARVVVVGATVNGAEVAVGLFVVAIRNRGAGFREFAELAGVVATTAVPDVGLLRSVMQLFKRRQDNTFAIRTMPVADRFVTGWAGHDFVVTVVVVQLFPPPRAGLRAINLRHVVVVVACVHGGGGAELFQIGLTAGRLRLGTRLSQRRQQHGRQNGDNRDDNQQFNQRKVLLLLI